ncbi:GNAT family N-acetyltransferase [Oceanicoccus sagamiensis]|uniref:GNAT family N-acetyltransferase n=1 Tax=Oceanicoccus sagamiensis TaxID=716816 RepID=UPI00198128A1|nr:GNAT family N-acetyltransferase [Oceanicoccus sagamiensis]
MKDYSDPTMQVALKQGINLQGGTHLHDPFRLNHNYGYVEQNPFNAVDPFGLDSFGSSFGSIGSVSGGGLPLPLGFENGFDNAVDQGRCFLSCVLKEKIVSVPADYAQDKVVNMGGELAKQGAKRVGYVQIVILFNECKKETKINTIRKYKEKDLENVVDIWYQSSTLAHPFLEPDFVKKVKKDMHEIYIPNSETWVYEEEDKIVGFIGMIGNEIGGLFVLPDQHSKGIGTKLVNLILELHDELEVEVFKKNKIGRAFYDKYGFEFMKEYFDEASNNDVLRLKFKK